MCENNLLWPWNSNRSIPEYQERHMSINRSPSIGLKTLFNVHNMYRMSNVTAAIFQNWICCVHTTMQLYARAGRREEWHRNRRKKVSPFDTGGKNQTNQKFGVRVSNSEAGIVAPKQEATLRLRTSVQKETNLPHKRLATRTRITKRNYSRE